MFSKSDVQDAYSLSPMQEGMLFHYLMDKESGAYFEQLTITVDGEVDIKIVEASFNKLVEKYDIFRTIYLYEKVKKIRQVVLKKRKSTVRYEDISHLDDAGQAELVHRFKDEDKKKGFELIRDIPMRIAVIKRSTQSFNIIWSFHHISMDGWSMPLAIKDFLDIYSRLRNRGEFSITPSTPFSTYIRWLHQQDKADAKRYWENILQDSPLHNTLPRENAPSNESELVEYNVTIPQPLTQALTQLVKTSNATINTLFQVIWGLLLQRYNHSRDVVFGAVVSGRPPDILGIEEMIGLFINTIPVRVATTPETVFSELLKEIQQAALQARAYEYLPLGEIMADMLVEELIDHVMVFENYPIQEHVKDSGSKSTFGFDILDVDIFNRTNYDFTFVVIPGESIIIKFLFNSPTYSREFMEDVAGHFINVAQQIVDNPGVKTSQLQLLTSAEKERIPGFYACADQDSGVFGNVLDTIFNEANRSTDAIVYDNGESSMCFGELDQLSDRVAHSLRQHNIQVGDVVIVDSDVDYHLVVAILGVLKTGAVFLPMNSDYPAQTRAHILANSNAKLLISDGDQSFPGDTINLGLLLGTRETPQEPFTAVQIKDYQQAAAIIYSSDSTDTEQPVTLSYLQLNQWLAFNMETLNMDFSNTLFISHCRFQTRFPLWLAPLCSGVPVFFSDGAQQWQDILNRKTFSTLICPLALLQEMETVPAHLRYIITAGQDLAAVETLYNHAISRAVQWVNYPVFPTAIAVTSFDNQWEVLRPAPFSRAAILDNDGHPLPLRIKGELHISGRNTLLSASWQSGGSIILHNHRHPIVNNRPIALHTIENHLLQYPSVNDCAVLPRRINGEPAHLTAFLVSSPAIDILQLNSFLKESMPPEIFPIGFVTLSQMPRTPGGVIDKNYLRNLDNYDTLQMEDFEDRINREPGIQQVALLTRETSETQPPLHLKDFSQYLGQTPDAPADAGTQETGSGPESNDDTQSAPQDVPMAIAYGDELTFTEDEPRLLPEALLRAAKTSKDKGVHFITVDGEEYYRTYPEILTDAKRVMAGLKKLGLKPGDRAIFQFDNDIDFVVGFWGCSLGGFVPVPVMVPKTWKSASNESKTLQGIWETLDKPIILTSTKLLPLISDFFKEFTVADVSLLTNNEADNDWHHADPMEPAILLFTSGSTGKPKGVVQTHHSILSREKGACMYCEHGIDDISLNWMPLEHVGGVVMFHIRDVWSCSSQVQVRGEYILTEPLRWLDLISMYRVTITWAPNFAFALINEGIEKRVEKGDSRDWELSCLRFILNAGEAISPRTTNKFLTLMEPFGLPVSAQKPAWGMSETCSAVTYSHNFRKEKGAGEHFVDKKSLSGIIKRLAPDTPHSANFTQLGGPIPGFAMRIADSSNQVLKEGLVGRLQVKGPSVLKGYYNNPTLNEEVYTSDGWFDTGDLAFMHNGSMTISGRAKDVIIVNGINLNSMEIEAAVEEVEGVEISFTAACAVKDEGSDTEKVAIFYCSQYNDVQQRLQQIRDIQKKFADKFRLNLNYVIPVTKEEIPKTSIGKIQRLKLGKAFEAGTYDQTIKEIDIGLENENTLPSWFFTQTWIHQNVQTSVPKQGISLLLEEQANLSQPLMKELNQSVSVTRAGNFTRVNQHTYQMDFHQPQQYNQLFQALEADNISIDHIFHLLTCTESQQQPTIGEATRNSIFSLLYLVQALGEEHDINLYVVSNNLQMTRPGETILYKNSSLLGFLRSLSHEISRLHISHIDLDEPGDLETSAASIIEEWRNLKCESEVAYRKHKRLVPSLRPALLEDLKQQARPFPIQKGGIYLVTGGLGGIGTHVCNWLVTHWQAKLLIAGRTPLPPKEQWHSVTDTGSTVYKRIQAYQEINSHSQDIIYLPGDLNDATYLKQLESEGQKRWQHSISGIFHLAGEGNLQEHWSTMEKRWVTKSSPASYEAMFLSKIHGTLALHQLIEDQPDVLLVAFSSTTGLFGASTFSAYAAANTFLDSFCLHRRNSGYANTFCLTWSSWNDIGMSLDNPVHMVNAMQASGNRMIPVPQGLLSMAIALGSHQPRLFIGLDPNNAKISRHMKHILPGKQQLSVYYTLDPHKDETSFNSRQFQQTVSTITGASQKKGILLQFHPLEKIPMKDGAVDYTCLMELEEAQAQGAVGSDLPITETEKVLANIWQEILGKTAIGRNDSFFELGGHSLKATLMVANIHKKLQVRVPLSEVFTRPSIRDLAELIDEANQDRFDTIQPASEKPFYHLSSGQKRLYIVQQMDPDNIGYNIPQVMILEGDLQKEKLEETLKQVILRHESLRTAFEVIDDEPVQKIYLEVDFAIDYIDMFSSEQNPPDRLKLEETILSLVKPFDLSQPPLIRVALIKHQHNSHVLVVDMHHTISDGTSHGVLINDFMSYYLGNQPLEPLRIQYKDFSEWQNSQKNEAHLVKQNQYWYNEFSDSIPVIDLHTDFPRPAIQSYQGRDFAFSITPRQTAALKEIAAGENVTLFMLLLAVFNVLLAKHANQEDIVVGSAIAGRRHADLQPIIGMFVNTLVMRNFPAAHKTFNTFLQEVREKTLKAFENQECQYEDLVQHLVKDRDVSRNPLFDVMFALQNMELSDVEMPGLKLKPYTYEKKTAKFDLMLQAIEADDTIYFEFEYCIKLFLPETVERFANHFKRIVDGVIEDPSQPLFQLSITSEVEKEFILKKFNNTRTDYPNQASIHSLFAEQAQQTPDAIAVVNNDRSISYSMLQESSRRLAAYLLDKSVVRGEPVAIMAQRSMEMVIGVMGIIKAGAAYMPVDDNYPPARKTFIMQDGSVRFLLKFGAAEAFPHEAEEIDITEASGPQTNAIDLPQHHADDLAYIMYTSGSTGRPKGIMVQHRCVTRLVKSNSFVSYFPDDHILQTGALSFDASTFEIWGALLNGLQLHLANKEDLLAETSLKEILWKQDISTIWMTAPLFNQMSDADIQVFARLRNLLVGGDILSPPHIDRVRAQFPHLNVINGYGPTENTTFSTTHLIQEEYAKSIPIGKPIANSSAYIFDQHDNLLPGGVPGELIVGGDGVARGYLNNPELSIEKFFHHPSVGRCYRTGDLARWLPDGTIEFLGRIDQQVKLRGFRIEMGEIESRLLKHETIREARVLVFGEKTDKYLCAYYAADQEIPASRLRPFLTLELPDYMVPSHYVCMEKLPLNANGKVDLNALPKPRVTAAEEEYAAPENETETIIANAWKEVLNLEKVSVNANFFEIGGNSLNIIKVKNNLKVTLGKDIPVVNFFTYPTIQSFAVFLNQQNGQMPQEEVQKRTDQMERGKNKLKKMKRKRRT